jgi:hypothetical protein
MPKTGRPGWGSRPLLSLGPRLCLVRREEERGCAVEFIAVLKTALGVREVPVDGALRAASGAGSACLVGCVFDEDPDARMTVGAAAYVGARGLDDVDRPHGARGRPPFRNPAPPPLPPPRQMPDHRRIRPVPGSESPGAPPPPPPERLEAPPPTPTPPRERLAAAPPPPTPQGSN